VTPLDNVCAEKADAVVVSDAVGLDGPVEDEPLQAAVARSAAEIAGPITILVIAKKLRGAM